jgi:Uma2 family endonuclease
MATRTSTTGSGLVPYRLTVDQFLRMIDANVFPDETRVELLGGILVEMTTSDAHDYLVTRLANLLRPLLPAGSSLREEKSLQLGRYWRPQPDIVILKDRDVAFARRAPRADDVVMLIEVADSSYLKDSGRKLRRSADVGIPVYWIVHVEKSQIEVYREPRGRKSLAHYQKVEVYDVLAEVPVAIDGQERGRIDVAELFPQGTTP